jgi:hypothetical protein
MNSSFCNSTESWYTNAAHTVTDYITNGWCANKNETEFGDCDFDKGFAQGMCEGAYFSSFIWACAFFVVGAVYICKEGKNGKYNEVSQSEQQTQMQSVQMQQAASCHSR